MLLARSRSGVCHLGLLFGILFAGQAGAQVSGSLTLVSDYRFRGVSLSDENPAAQLAVAYDHGSGWYAGTFASTVQLANQSRRNLQALTYLGYASRVNSLAWEAGLSYSVFSGTGGYGYPEVYGGLASNNFSGRVYYAPDYFGQGSGALYAELNGTRPLLDRLHLLGHLGILRRNSRSTEGAETNRYQYDVRIGIGIDLESANVQLAWVVTDAANTVYPVGENHDRRAFVLSLSRAF